MLSQCLIDGCGDTVVVFAHGAGANMHHEFMTTMASGLSKAGFQVVRFNFPYMQANAKDGKRRPPDRAPKLVAHFDAQLQALKAELQPKRVVLMGKSMGGRMAAILAADTTVDAVICLGYPFAPKPESEPRIEPIEQNHAPMLIVQGDRDKFGTRDQIRAWPIPSRVQFEWLNDGDHSFKPRKVSGATLAGNMSQAISACIQFIGELDA
nr:alpha/beta fold hydrolase [Shewanella gelidii]